MANIINSKFLSFLLILLNLFYSINNQFNEQAALKAISCVSVVTNKFRKGEDEPNRYSPIVLACFMKITEDQAHRVLSGLEEGEIPLEPYEIDELTNVEKLKDYPQEEVEQNAELLETAIKDFQKFDEEFDSAKENRYSENEDYDQDYDDDDDDDDFSQINRNNKMSTKGFFGLIKNGVGELFSVAGGIWYTFFILIIIYLMLMIVRKSNDLEKNVKTTKESEQNEKEKKDKEEKEKEKEKENNVENEKEKIKDKEKAKAD